MTYSDKSLVCSDCGATFTFSAAEQEFYATKGLKNEPKRCQSCRKSKKNEQRGGGNSYSSGPRRMFPAVCAQCGKETEVPFEPREGRPVLCRDCYKPTR
ncbi:MAG: zinc-ribbon domain containing protein [Chloroflexi bacterium]|nr:zinc-ribbon domain containing protein [Chloroflexota bacterium]